MSSRNHSKSIKIYNLTYNAMAISLSVVFLMLFKGTTSILSAIGIPIALAVMLKAYQLRDLLSIVALLLITITFFTTQLFFVLGYFVMAWMLRALLIDPSTASLLKTPLIGFGLYLMTTVATLYAGLRLTEAIFAVPLHQMMLRLSQGHSLIYFSILFAEALIIAVTHFAVLKMVMKRLNSYPDR